MKKLLASFALLATVTAHSQNPQMIGATYLTCSDSVTGLTGETMRITTSVSGSVKTYQISGSSATGENYLFKIKDYNGGTIQAGDSIRVTSATYTICNVTYNLRPTAFPAFTVSSGTGNPVYIEYTDCILPLNGTSGTIRIRFTQ